MDKVTQIKAISSEIENMPSDFKSKIVLINLDLKDSPSHIISPIGSLLDNSFLDLSKIVDDRNKEIKQLKLEISQLQQENSRIKKNNDSFEFNGSKPNVQYQLLQDNCFAIFSHLKISGLNPPTLGSIDHYVASLRSIMDRSNK
jgi:hypothetical protein